MIEHFWGNRRVVTALESMVARDRIPQTLLFAGPAGVGKATLARRLAEAVLPNAQTIERDDQSLPENVKTIAEREKWTAEKRNEDPLFFAAHPDFLTFVPEGPLRQLTIAQMRALREHAQYLPNEGRYRIFLIDHLERANEQAANSLLKILEEPPPYLILIGTTENPFELLPTIRSRAITLQFQALDNATIRAFAAERNLSDLDRRIALSAGSPGAAVSLDLDSFSKRRSAMLLLIAVAAGVKPFAEWIPVSESLGRTKTEKLDVYLKALYALLRDILLLKTAKREIRNEDIANELRGLAGRFSREGLVRVMRRLDEMADLVRRNIQKIIALDDLLLDLQRETQQASSRA